MAEVTLSGRCLCGACTFTARFEGDAAARVCHCGMCRHWSGGMFIAAQALAAPVFAEGAPVGVYASSGWGERVFCRDCGASLMWRSTDGAHHSVSVQCFDDAGRFPVQTEIFIDEKPASYALAGSHLTMTGAEVMAMYAPQQES